MPQPTGPTRSVLITGCSSGIGRDAADALRARGWRVFATCRQEADCARLRDEGHESLRLDYEDPASIAAAWDEIASRTGGRLDALFNNGAYAIPGAVEDVPPDALRAIFEANLFGWHDLTRRAVVQMRRQGQGRIVQCSSVLGRVAAPWRGAYVATKFALEGLTDTLRLELRGSGIRVVLIEPGPIGTRFRQNAARQFERWIDWEASALAERYRSGLLQRLYGAGKPDRLELPASAVTARLIRALEDPSPRARYRVTLPTAAAEAMRRTLPTSAMDRVLGGR